MNTYLDQLIYYKTHRRFWKETLRDGRLSTVILMTLFLPLPLPIGSSRHYCAKALLISAIRAHRWGGGGEGGPRAKGKGNTDLSCIIFSIEISTVRKGLCTWAFNRDKQKQQQKNKFGHPLDGTFSFFIPESAESQHVPEYEPGRTQPYKWMNTPFAQ